jgi:hypothetical protein
MMMMDVHDLVSSSNTKITNVSAFLARKLPLTRLGATTAV